MFKYIADSVNGSLIIGKDDILSFLTSLIVTNLLEIHQVFGGFKNL